MNWQTQQPSPSWLSPSFFLSSKEKDILREQLFVPYEDDRKIPLIEMVRAQ